jgi:hypothetical protein
MTLLETFDRETVKYPFRNARNSYSLECRATTRQVELAIYMADKKADQGDEDVFMSRMNRWSDRNRSNWSWDKRPSHRQLTIGASLAQDALLHKNAKDKSALEDVELSLTAMDTYLSGGHDEERNAASVIESSAAVVDLMKVKETSKAKAIENLARIAAEDESRRAAQEEADRANAPPDSARSRPQAALKPFDPMMLESVRRHNAFRQKMLESRKRNQAVAQAAMNFHALPLPGHVSALKEDDAQPEDSLSELVASTAKKQKPDLGPAFFVTEGDKGSGEDSDMSSSAEDDDGDHVGDLPPAATAAQVALPVPSSKPAVPEISNMDSARSARSEKSSRPSTQRSEYTESGLLDLDQMERQTLWLIRKHKKQMERQKQIEMEALKDVSVIT